MSTRCKTEERTRKERGKNGVDNKKLRVGSVLEFKYHVDDDRCGDEGGERGDRQRETQAVGSK